MIIVAGLSNLLSFNTWERICFIVYYYYYWEGDFRTYAKNISWTM